jgi:hypothetical protein
MTTTEYAVSDDDRYVFDLNGFLVLKAVLSSDEVAELNAIIDERCPPPTEERPAQLIPNVLGLGKPFQNLLDHPRILPYLTEWVDPALRADLLYGAQHAKGAPIDPLHLGNEPYSPLVSYTFRNGRPYSVLTVVSWALTEVPPCELPPSGPAGGFGCIPGSHKANYSAPKDVRQLERNPGYAVSVPMEPGDAVIFTEALTHGTIPWTHDHVRRVLFYRYAPGYAIFEPQDWPQDVLDQLNPRQRALLEPPYGRRGSQQIRKPILSVPTEVVPLEPGTIALDCMCGQRLVSTSDEALTELVRVHIEDVHEEFAKRITEDRLLRYVEVNAVRA